MLSGFSRKSIAPRRVACTAASIVAWPLIMMTGTSFSAARSRGEQADAVAVGERHVEEADVVAPLLELLLGDRDAAGDVDGVALERERLLEGGEDRGLVVDDEEMRVGHGENRLSRTVERRTRNRPGAGQRAAEPWHSRGPSDPGSQGVRSRGGRLFEVGSAYEENPPGRCAIGAAPDEIRPPRASGAR